MKKVLVLVLAVVFLAGLVLAGCGSAAKETTTTAAPTTTTMAPATTTTMAPATTTTMAPATTTTMAPAAAPIAWNEAIKHEKETGTVTGPVMAVVDKGAGIDKWIIQVGSTGDDGFNATVEYANLDKFGGAAGLQALMGKTIAVTGEIYVNSFELKAEILLTDAAQLTVAAAAAAPIAWNEAIKHEKETGTVTGPVMAVVDKGAGIDKWIIQVGSTGDDGFNATVEYANLDKFGGAAGLQALMGKTIAVTGEIYVNSFELKAEILLTDAAQLTVPIMWNEAIKHEKETGTVTGPVMAVVDKGAGIDKWIIQVGSTGDDGFNATVEYANLDKFGGAAGLQALMGKTIAVTGEIYVNSFELKAEILLTEAAQLHVMQ